MTFPFPVPAEQPEICQILTPNISQNI